MESELKKAVNLYEKGQLNSAKEIALNVQENSVHGSDSIKNERRIHKSSSFL